MYYLTSSLGTGFPLFATANTVAAHRLLYASFAPVGMYRIPECLSIPHPSSPLRFHVLCISSDPHHCRQKPPSWHLSSVTLHVTPNKHLVSTFYVLHVPLRKGGTRAAKQASKPNQTLRSNETHTNPCLSQHRGSHRSSSVNQGSVFGVS